MKMFNKKLILSLGCVLLLQQVQANIFTNMAKAAVDYMAGKVEKGISYIDQVWFNVEQELCKPMEKAKSAFAAIKDDSLSLVMHYTDKHFPAHAQNDNAKKQTLNNVLYLIDQKKVVFPDGTELHCLKNAHYATGLRAVDYINVRTLVTNAIASVQLIKDSIEPIFKKSYARKNQRIFTDVIRGHEQDNVFVTTKAKEFKQYFWSKICINNPEIVNKLLNPTHYQQTVDDLYKEFNKQIEESKDEHTKNALKALIDQTKYTVLLDEALDMFVTLNGMMQLLNNIDSATKLNTFVDPILDEYHTLVVARANINKEQKNINQDQLFAFVQKNPQEMINVLNNRPVVIAQEIQQALIDGVLIDPAHKDKTVFKTNYSSVQAALLNICRPTVAMFVTIRSYYESLPIINNVRIGMPSCGTKTIKDHFNNFTGKDYVVFAQELADAIIKKEYAEKTPEPLKQQYKDIIVEYAKVRCLHKLCKKLRKMSDGTALVTQIYELLNQDKNIQNAYNVVQKNKAIFDKNHAVKALQLSSDTIDLDTLLENRGATFSVLKQRCNVMQAGSWEAASTIVKTGENAYEAYLHMISRCKSVLNLSAGFDFDGHINQSLEYYVNSIVTKVVAARNGSKKEALNELDDLNKAFEKYVSEANFTDKARTIIKEIGALYLQVIKEALKAQVIAAWYVHDIAWKMESEAMTGPKGSVLNGLRKITPMSGKSIQLEVVS